MDQSAHLNQITAPCEVHLVEESVVTLYLEREKEALTMAAVVN